MPGMLAGCGGRKMRSRRSGGPPYRNALPDLTDPATLGCVRALVREARRDSAAHTVPDGDWYVRGDMPGSEYGTGETERAALVAALEAAPVRGAS